MKYSAAVRTYAGRISQECSRKEGDRESHVELRVAARRGAATAALVGRDLHEADLAAATHGVGVAGRFLEGERREEDGGEARVCANLLEDGHERLARVPDVVGGESMLERDGRDAVERDACGRRPARRRLALVDTAVEPRKGTVGLTVVGARGTAVVGAESDEALRLFRTDMSVDDAEAERAVHPHLARVEDSELGVGARVSLLLSLCGSLLRGGLLGSSLGSGLLSGGLVGGRLLLRNLLGGSTSTSMPSVRE